MPWGFTHPTVFQGKGEPSPLVFCCLEILVRVRFDLCKLICAKAKTSIHLCRVCAPLPQTCSREQPSRNSFKSCFTYLHELLWHQQEQPQANSSRAFFFRYSLCWVYRQLHTSACVSVTAMTKIPQAPPLKCRQRQKNRLISPRSCVKNIAKPHEVVSHAAFIFYR